VTTVSPLILCLVFAVSNVGAAPMAAQDDEAKSLPYHEVNVGLGSSDEGAFMLISWTGKRRVGVYFKPYLFDKDEQAQANRTVVKESAAELGLTFRVHPTVTLGAGYGSYERVVTVYGPSFFIAGFTTVLDETEENDVGLAGMILLSIPTQSQKVGWSFALSSGPAGAGASFQISLRTPR